MQSKAARTFSLHPLKGQTLAEEYKHRCMQYQAHRQAEMLFQEEGTTRTTDSGILTAETSEQS